MKNTMQLHKKYWKHGESRAILLLDAVNVDITGIQRYQRIKRIISKKVELQCQWNLK